MAPEQAAGKAADALTDVYAVGGLLYEMLTATPPCVGDDAIEVLHRKATEDPQPIGELLLVIAILLFPLDVALRRLVFSAEDLPVWRAAMTRAPAAPLPAEATVTRLRERVSGVRAARGTKPPPPD